MVLACDVRVDVLVGGDVDCGAGKRMAGVARRTSAGRRWLQVWRRTRENGDILAGNSDSRRREFDRVGHLHDDADGFERRCGGGRHGRAESHRRHGKARAE